MSVSSQKSTSTLQKFTHNFWSVLSIIIIMVFGIMAILAYALAPDSSQNANQMHLSIHSKPPGFTTKLLKIPNTRNQYTQQSLWEQLISGTVDTSTEIPFSELKIIDNHLWIYPYTSNQEQKGIPKKVSLIPFKGHKNLDAITKDYTSTKTFILGSDKYGRDLLSRLLIGSRVSFSIGFIAVLISLIIGISLGAIAGYFGGTLDNIIMWVINVVWSIPTLLLVIAITLALGKGLFQVYIAVGLTMWVEVARVVRGQVISIKEQQYITAAKTLGYSHLRTLWYHILPNSIGPVIVISAANFASAILIESGLSFLGIGAQPPVPSWGSMIKDHYSYIILGKAYLALAPGLAIMLLVMSFMLLGNGIRDVLDVKN